MANHTSKIWPASYFQTLSAGALAYQIIYTHVNTDSTSGIQEISILTYPSTSINKPIGCLSAQLITRDSLKAILHSELPGRPDVQRCLRTFFTPRFRLRDEIVEHPKFKGSGVWGREIEQVDLGFVDGIWTDAKWRKKGIGKGMVEMMKKIARDHDVKFIITLPSYLPAASSWKSKTGDENWRPWDEDIHHDSYNGLKKKKFGFCRFNRRFESHYDIELQRSKSFWRACGARRIGLKPWFGIAVGELHAANWLPADLDIEDIHHQDRWKRMPYKCTRSEMHDISACEQEALVPTISSELADFMNNYNDKTSVVALYDQISKHGKWAMTAELKRMYAFYPLIHIAIDHGKVKSLKWFTRLIPDLVAEVTNFDGYSVLEYLELTIELTRERRYYQEAHAGLEMDIEIRMEDNLERALDDILSLLLERSAKARGLF